MTKEGVSFPIHREGELYCLYRVSTNISNVKSCNLEKWHKILGHCNSSNILKLEKVADGMKITDKVDAHCCACVG